MRRQVDDIRRHCLVGPAEPLDYIEAAPHLGAHASDVPSV
jgi:hypothetical protein